MTNQLDRIEQKLDKLINIVGNDGDDNRTEHQIVELHHYTSNSGNPTWKAISESGDIIYLRQNHKQILTEIGLWGDLNEMSIGETRNCEIKLWTLPDGDFMRVVEIEQGWGIDQPEKDGISHLREILESGDFIVLDTETTELHGYVCQLAILNSEGQPLIDTLVKPPQPITDAASIVHGITNEMVADAPMMEDLIFDLQTAITKAKSIVGWNIDFDRSALKRSINGVSITKLLLDSSKFIDLMRPFAEIYGEWNEYHGNYKWQKLTTAASYYDIPTNGAHSAIDDCRMTLEVMKHMAGVK